MDKPRVLIVQPNLNPPGGGQCVSAWAVQALQDEYALDVFSWIPMQVDNVNRFFGTTLDARKFKNYYPPGWLRAIVNLDPDPWSYQPAAMMMRMIKWRRDDYALMLSFCDEMDLGKRAIQYVHFPFLWHVYQRDQELRGQGRWRARGQRMRLWRLVAGFSFERMKQNRTFVNSDWTGAHFTRAYGAPAQTLYPPVLGNFPDVLWAERESGFVCIGRISGEKRYEDIVEILAAVRARGHAIHLHIIGALRDPVVDLPYYCRVTALVEQNKDWVTLHENIAHTELAKLVGQHRYGIHAMHAEPFGIAPAEMVGAGCIAFVFNDGGQVEIVGNDERLRYDSSADAVEKIARVLEDEGGQSELRRALGTRAELFTGERFMRALREIVAAEIHNAAG